MFASPAALAAYGGAPALITRDGVVTYAGLAARVSAAAAELGSVRRLVLVEGGNDVGSVVAYLGALAGGHPVLLSAGGAPLASLREAYDPDVVVSGGSVTEVRAGSAHDLHPDLALLLSTSGTTGSPKLVRLSYGNLQANADSIATYLGIGGDDRAATTLPMHYCYGLSVLNSHLARGAALLLTDLSVVDPCFWAFFREHGGTSFAGVPYTFDLLDRVGFAAMDLPSLRYVTQAGGRLAPERVRAYAALGRERGWSLYVMYGQTEATARMAYLPPALAETHPDAVGVPVPGGSFALEDGELVYTGPNVMLGYAHGPADLRLGRTVARLRTGDLAVVSDGLYRIVGRRSRFVKVFGLRVDLERVEAGLATSGVVAACADADDRLMVAVEGRADADALRRSLAASYGLPPRAVVVRCVPSLPRLCGGKVDYAAVRALSASPAERLAGARDLRAVYAAVLERDDVTDDDTFVGLGGDSLSYVELSLRVEEALGHLPPAWHVTPIRSLVPAGGRPRRGRSVETSVVLRAVAILLVVATHANLVDLQGGAHALLAVAGFNYARFHLAGGAARVRNAVRSVARVALPSMAWIAGLLVLTDHYRLPNVVLLNGVLGRKPLGPRWQFWFVEALVYTLIALTAVLAVPLVRRVERRAPFWTALAFFGTGLLPRYGLVPVGGSDKYYTAHVVFWLFALGWVVAQASSWRHRVVATALAVVTVPGFFETRPRALLVLGAVLALAWVPTVRWPARLAGVTGALASASLYVYLVHWQVFPHLQLRSPLLATALSIAAGLAYWQVVTVALPALARRVRQAVARRQVAPESDETYRALRPYGARVEWPSYAATR
ncbi:MAG TPA: AMP-binding protein [Frankiaceae bacterium]|nr:AMP-binding protein [Frankiaceae bacterium]